jgi:SulP family sulfate permease
VPAWLRNYRVELLPHDLIAGIIVAIMLVPQSMGYALVAGVPPQYGMYASILPLIAYAALGSSMTLAVGPVAVTSLMTAAALAPLFAPGSDAYIAAAAMLALLSGLLLLIFGVLRFGFIAKLLSNPVISGFTSGSSLLILIGQLPSLLGVGVAGGSALATAIALFQHADRVHPATASIGVGALALLILARNQLGVVLRRAGVSPRVVTMAPKLAPMLIVLAAIVLSSALQWHQRLAVAIVGVIPQGLPSLQLSLPSLVQFKSLLFPAAAIALINFVSSISVAQSLALQRKERINADAELRALGAANIASAISGGFAVNGGFARSLVNFSAGAQTPFAGVVSAALMAIVIAGFSGLFTALPVAVLAATIIIAVAPVIDIKAFRQAWQYDRADALALAATALGVVVLGVEAGIAIGIGVSLASLVWRSSHPHIAVLGRVPFTEHFRNVLRYQTETLAHVLALRVDENLLFANAHAVEQRIRDEVEKRPDVRHVVVVLSSVSQIDTTAMAMLVELNEWLRTRDIDFNFAEIKGPVLAQLDNSPLMKQLSGKIFMSTHTAFMNFSSETEDYSI